MSFYRGQGPLIHYKFIHQGLDQTLVFIHSLGTDFRIWDEMVEILTPHSNILLYDLRGHGLSSSKPALDGLHDYCSDLMALISFLNIHKNIIPIGLSVGGLIAQLLVGQNPESISKLILCDTCYTIGIEATWNDRIKKVNEDGLSSISGDVVGRWFSTDYKSKYPERVEGFKNMLERTPLQGYIHTCAAIRDADTIDIARCITIPTLCLVGAEDKSTTPEDVKRLADQIKGSLYSIIEDSGHLPCIDNPEKMSNLIFDFISQ